MKKLVYFLIFSLQFASITWSGPSFVVKQIKFDGLHYINASTVESYLPLKRGQTVSAAQTSALLKALYQTGFFEYIRLEQDGHTLIIHVIERPVIGALKISGNSMLQTDKLTSVLKSMEIAEGRVYNASILERIKQSLLSQYYQLGHYNAEVTITTLNLSRNRLAVNIQISEGLSAKIAGINIIGNQAFSKNTLLKEFDLSAGGLFSYLHLSQNNIYSEEKLEYNIEKLRAFYLDHGYLHFTVKSYQAEVTPDRKSVYINIVINEGNPYTVKSFTLSGQLALPKAELMQQISFKEGEVFSRRKLIDSEKAITKLLGEKGYMFATINIEPQVNEATHEVSLHFKLQSGKRAYVRQINFSDNQRTNDQVLRREVQQLEAAPISTTKLEESKHRLNLLPFIKNVDMTVTPSAEQSDQVDVNYKVTEDSSAQATFNIGYSATNHLLLGAGFNQANFLGTGNTIGLNLQHSKYEKFYTFDYTNPYYTDEGISRSLSVSISKVDPGQVSGVNSDYTTNEYDIGMIFGIPVGQEQGAFNRIITGATYQNTLMKLTGNVSQQVNDFVTRHGRHFQELDLRMGYTRDTRNRAIFPTAGTLHSLFADGYLPLDHNSLTFYTLNYHMKWYYPLFGDYIAFSRADFGYGNGLHGINDYPIFRNFYAGGMDSVRGYSAYTLGPRDSSGALNSNGKAIGGNILVDASIALIFPNAISDNLRTMAYFDAGNVYSSSNNRQYGGSSTNSGPVRLSLGLEADWLSPFGLLRLSAGVPLNKRRGDDTQLFDFAFGANF